MFESIRCCQCGEPVRLPNEYAVVWVRCPHCKGEYPLEMIVNQLPPPLEAIPHVGSADGTDAERKKPMARRRKSGPLAVVFGGIAGLVLGQLVLWWVPEPYRTDPLQLGPKIPEQLSFIAPPSIRGGGEISVPLLPTDEMPTVLQPNPEAEANPADDLSATFAAEPVAPPDGQVPIPEGVAPGTPEVVVGLADAPQIGIAELRKSLRAAADENRSLSGKAEWSEELVDKWYSKLGEFAFNVTFANTSETGIDEFAKDAKELLARVMGSEKKLTAVGELGGQRIGDVSQHRQGILVAGTAKAIEPAGQLFQTDLEPPGDAAKVIHVVSRSDPRQQQAYAVGDKILIAGVVVVDPGLYLLGYEGDAETVVLGGLPIATK